MTDLSRHRWTVIAILFGFMLLHQTDRLLIGPMTERIIQEFNITDAQMGRVSTGALLVGAVLFPVWGYLYDRYARSKLLALASFIWGATTWMNAIARSYISFFFTRASTGIDDSSYPGLYSLVSDYFGPSVRGKIYGFLQITQPLGYLVGMLLGLLLSGVIGWRGVFYITGSLGIVLAFVIWFGVKEPPRGKGEPELAGFEEITTVRFDWKIARQLFKKRSLIPLYLQGFFGVFPWNAITFWFFAYLQRERAYSDNTILGMMTLAVLVLAAGYPLGGALGDSLFKRNPRGRLIVAVIGVVLGALMLVITLNIPNENTLLFTISLAVNALLIPFASANVISTVYDVTLPEVRSTSISVMSFIESIGAALSPWLVGEISDRASLKAAFLLICVVAWLICAFFFLFAARFVPEDIKTLRLQMQERANQERLALTDQRIGD
jgi:MFS family permease